MADIVLVSKDEMFRKELSKAIHELGHRHKIFASTKELLALGCGEYEVAIIESDFSMLSDMNIINDCKWSNANIQVIIISGATDFNTAEAAFTKGAWEYFQKPLALYRVKAAVQRAVEFSMRKKAMTPVVLNRCGIIGSSPSMMTCLEFAARCADTESNILITSATGTGKELFAKAIHYNSIRKDSPFIIVDCAALPDNLVESILFGHEKGSFTTAERKHQGLIRMAHGGTLFLDEIGEMPLRVQKAFLRVLQERVFRPVGGTKEIYSDFRLVAATNKNIHHMVEQGAFRRDLYYRLQTVTFNLPPLKGREGDIKELFHHFFNRISREYGIENKGFSSDFMDALTGYSWPGNVRELINTIEHAMIAAKNDPSLFPEHLPLNIRIHNAQRIATSIEQGRPDSLEASAPTLPELKTYRAQSIAALERKYLRDLLDITGGKIHKACELSGMSRPRLYALLKKHDIR